ncbi:alpha-1,2-fucosyltransferase [uncultured Methanoregula sp.]|uniref:alpha-1,2-fucosyltransferase n=1 Tax=uncultured Methanoregula sp. TaxID=1005933 RepID=UPI002AAC1BC0|nr:alpha-1,2-fucosyltransferase [uncultured Methanoregula sp.]
MIIVRIIGGLGNQMFQYAVGRAIALKNGVELKLDISAFDSYKLHQYGLNNFNIVENIATEAEVKKLTRWKIEVPEKFKKYYRIFDNSFSHIIPYYKQKYVKERDYPFDPNILKIIDNTYLDGYWGSEKYFLNIESTIRNDFTLKHESDAENIKIADKINRTNSISVHFRRGDYVTDPTTNAIHGTCSIDYYYRAIEDVCKYVTDPHFFIFSNDPEWVKEHFSIPHPVYLISVNGPERNYEDMHLMSLCKHHIIANSTFSWWGAWLGKNKDRRVYTPKSWYNVDYINQKDTFPESWHKL